MYLERIYASLALNKVMNVLSIYKKYPIICLDFDGVVHSYTSGWKGSRIIPDLPVEGALDWMHKALNRNYRVAILSSRSKYFMGRFYMRAWLREHAGDFWFEHMDRGLEDVEFPKYKPSAIISIDDRAIMFTGRFPTLEEIKGFKPWNKVDE